MRSSVAAIAAAAVTAVAVCLAGHWPGHHHNQPVQGVCVLSGALPLVDRDVQFVATITTPGPDGCPAGATFVAAGQP